MRYSNRHMLSLVDPPIDQRIPPGLFRLGPEVDTALVERAKRLLLAAARGHFPG